MENQQQAQVPDQKVVVPTDIWKKVSSFIGTRAWAEVRVLRHAVHNAFVEAGINVAAEVTPTALPVSVALFNQVTSYLTTQPHDSVDEVMTMLNAFITSENNRIQAQAAQIQAQVAAAQAAADVPTPANDAVPVTAPAAEAAPVAAPVEHVVAEEVEAAPVVSATVAVPTTVAFTEQAPAAAAPAATPAV